MSKKKVAKKAESDSTFYRGYPDFSTTLSAGKELVRLSTSGEVFSNLPRTGAILDTIVGGTLAIYPGAPTAAMKLSKLSAKQEEKADELCNDLQAAVNALQGTPDNGALRAGAGDISTWIPVILAVIELLRNRRRPPQG